MGRFKGLQALSPDDLQAVYDGLPPATVVPRGPFNGFAWSHDAEWTIRLARAVWRGKIFTGLTVINRLGGRLLVRGHVRLEAGDVVIHYPRLPGLVDRMRPLDRWAWLGRMQLGARLIWFTLEPAKG